MGISNPPVSSVITTTIDEVRYRSGYYMPTFKSNNATVAAGFGADTTLIYPFTPSRSFTSSHLRVNGTSAVDTGKLASVVIYASDTNGFPGELLYRGTNFTWTAGAGVKDLVCAFSFLSLFPYWIGGVADSAISLTGTSQGERGVPDGGTDIAGSEGFGYFVAGSFATPLTSLGSLSPSAGGRILSWFLMV